MRFLLLLFVLAAAASLASCSTVQIPEKVSVEVPVACLTRDQVPATPYIHTAADLLAMPRGLRTLHTWLDRLKLEIYSSELAALVEGCSRITARPP